MQRNEVVFIPILVKLERLKKIPCKFDLLKYNLVKYNLDVKPIGKTMLGFFLRKIETKTFAIITALEKKNYSSWQR